MISPIAFNSWAILIGFLSKYTVIARSVSDEATQRLGRSRSSQ
jgi:hypothetical protein